jgi:SAM-dependent methyltransferase
MADREVFARIYRDNLWDQGSGPGSGEEYTRPYRAALHRFLQANAIKSVADVGCGDWQSTQFIDWHGATYIGYDVVPSVVEANREKFARPNVAFEPMPDDYRQIAEVDLILCKDVLQHLSLAHAEELLSALQHRARYVLITNCVVPEERLNLEIGDGDWRPLDISRDPFQRRPVNLAVFHTKKMQLLVRGLD